MPWTRRIGGKFGVDIQLPAGCYSDDTQLRLSTSRAIRGNGSFDVEAFSKVELPVWLGYQLGGGRGTKAAAAALARRSTTWFNNFFEKPASYIDAGGNGAAMRIQPHVWCSRDLSRPEAYLLDVMRNSICTHGHPRGFLGALFHAVLLASTLRNGQIPRPDDWVRLLDCLRIVPNLLATDDQLVSFWQPTWERATGSDFENRVVETINECKIDIERIRGWLEGRRSYPELVEALDAFTPEHRGSGTKSVLLGVALAWTHQTDPVSAIREAALCIGSDTDSIATLAGALLGAGCEDRPPGPISDESYIVREAIRLSEIAAGRRVSSFRYPNLLKWVAPSPTAVVGKVNGSIGVAGLGLAVGTGGVIEAHGKSAGRWQWVGLEFGQQILARVSDPLPKLKPSQLPDIQTKTDVPPPPAMKQADLDLFAPYSTRRTLERVSTSSPLATPRRGLTMEEATQRIVESQFDPRLIGELLLYFADGDTAIENTIAFAAIVAKARTARLRRAENHSGEPSPRHR
jgi:ADP-ribosylglycohydrolase